VPGEEGVFDIIAKPGIVIEEGTPINKTTTVPDSLAERTGYNPITDNPTIADILDKLLPTGAIIMWSGAITDIPMGWVLCDGTNGTPDLRNRFIVGAGDKYDIGATGGEDTHVLTIAEMPAHNHTGSTNSTGAHTHTVRGGTGTSDHTYPHFSSAGTGYTSSTSSAGAHSHTVITNNSGGGTAHENRPPYYALAYIMKK